MHTQDSSILTGAASRHRRDIFIGNDNHMAKHPFRSLLEIIQLELSFNPFKQSVRWVEELGGLDCTGRQGHIDRSIVRSHGTHERGDNCPSRKVMTVYSQSTRRTNVSPLEQIDLRYYSTVLLLVLDLSILVPRRPSNVPKEHVRLSNSRNRADPLFRSPPERVLELESITFHQRTSLRDVTVSSPVTPNVR